MDKSRCLALAAAVAALVASTGCASLGEQPVPLHPMAERSTTHRGGDDLLTAGLGLDGLRSMAGPVFAEPAAPTPAEVRRRAIWSGWRGITDLVPGGGYGSLYGSTATVPGREFSALLTVPGATHPHRVVVQVPDAFDATRRCLLVAPASGSRGAYGAIAVAGAWGLPRGCAVAYTDKGAGSDYFDLDAGLGIRADGTAGARGNGLAFEPVAPAATGVAVKHAHSGDNPEAQWGAHVRQAARYGLQVLGHAFPDAAPFYPADTRVIAVGISNGGGAVLRAAEADEDLFDAVVAGEPNIHVDGHGARALYDYGTQAATLMPCALLDIPDLAPSPLTSVGRAVGTQRCASLAANGTLEGADLAAQAREARTLLANAGWTEGALRAGALSVEFDLWRAVAVTYASAYGRYAVGSHPCGFGFSAMDGGITPRPATATERASWPSDAAGIPPGAGVGIVDTRMALPDATLPGLGCLRALWTGDGQDAARVRAGIAKLAAAPPRAGLPVVVVHGIDDGLVPQAFTSAPYVAMAEAAGRDVRYWQVPHAQHFDAFLGLPGYAARYVPLIPYMEAALDQVAAHLDGAGDLPADTVFQTRPRGPGVALEARHLALPD